MLHKPPPARLTRRAEQSKVTRSVRAECLFSRERGTTVAACAGMNWEDRALESWLMNASSPPEGGWKGSSTCWLSGIALVLREGARCGRNGVCLSPSDADAEDISGGETESVI